jgi:hypothetical protein
MEGQQRACHTTRTRSLLLQSTLSPRLTPSDGALITCQADTGNLTLEPETIAKNYPDFIQEPGFLEKFREAANSKQLKDFYQVGLFSYCEGDKDATTGKEKITHCSARKFQFHFNPMEVWGMQNTSVQNVLGDKFDKGMNAYGKAAGWMNWAFVITLVLTAVEFVVGFFAIFVRNFYVQTAYGTYTNFVHQRQVEMGKSSHDCCVYRKPPAISLQ